MNRSIRTALTAGALALTLSGTASAQLVMAERPETVVEAIQSLGYRATLDIDSAGDPMVKTSVNGWNSQIYFYGCKDNENCTALQFSVGFDLPNGTTLEAANKHIGDHLVGKVYLDEDNDPILTWLVVPGNSMTRSTFQDVFGWWELAVEDLEESFPFEGN